LAPVRNNEQKLRTTEFTEAFLRTQASTISRRKRLVVGDEICHATTAVASMATRDKVRDLIVETVTIEMIDDERTPPGACALHPFDFRAAPMTSVWSPANPIEQEQTMDRHLSVARMGERVVRTIKDFVFDDLVILPGLAA
jgi:hypothetical protein